MNTLKSTLFLFLFLQILAVNAQKEELKDVTVAMLEESKSPIEEDASSEILYERGEIRFTLRGRIANQLSITRRIKIYHSDGYDEADIEIYYYKGNNAGASEEIRKLKAYTYVLEGGNVKKIKLQKDAVFESNVSENLYVKKFSFPNIEEGAILEYSYTLDSPYVQSLRPWRFQSHIPTRYSECDVLVPNENIVYRIQQRGFEDIVQLSDKKSTADGKRVFVAKNLPAMEAENHVTNISNYISSIHFEIAQVSFGSEVQNFATSWDDVYKKFRDSETFKKELKRGKYFDDDLEEILANAEIGSHDDKIKAIYQFVQDKFDWNKKTARYVSDNLKKVYQKEIGNTADINIVLTAMLNAAGISAYPVYTSTISNGIPLFPTLTGYNNIIACAHNGNDDLILLDASNKFLVPGQISTYALNWAGIVLTEHNSTTIGLTDKNTSDQITTIMATIDEEGGISGMARFNYTRHLATKFRDNTEGAKESVKHRYYRERNNIEEIENFKEDNFYDLGNPLSHSFAFSDLKEYSENLSDKLFISPLLFLATEEHPFKNKERNYPIDYRFPQKFKHRIIYDLPEGYQIESLPEQEEYQVGDDVYHLVYQISERGGRIFVEVEFAINRTSVPAEYYDNIREFYTGVLDKQEEYIVLKKT